MIESLLQSKIAYVIRMNFSLQFFEKITYEHIFNIITCKMFSWEKNTRGCGNSEGKLN